MRRQKGFTLIELLIVVAIIGIIAAIAIPNLLRARISANEAAAISDLRTVISAAHVFASANNGYFPNTLAKFGPAAATEIPNYTGPEFLPPDIVSGIVKSGYTRGYAGFDEVDAAELPKSSSPKSGNDFLYGAWPSRKNLSGVRSFAGGADGTIYVTSIEVKALPDFSGGVPADWGPLGGVK